MPATNRRQLLAAGGLAAALLPWTGLRALAASPADWPSRSMDELSLAIFRSRAVRAARKEMEGVLRASANAAYPDAVPLIGQAVAEYAFVSAQVAANSDVTAPRLQWVQAREREFRGMHLPGGRYGVENPDNVYRWMPIDPTRRYRLTGRFAPIPPTATTWSLWTNQGVATSDIRTVGILTSPALARDGEGRFTITIGPGSGDPDHIATVPEAKILFIRETMGNWESQLPAAMTVECLDPLPAVAAPNFAERAAHAVAMLRSGIKAWVLDFQHADYDSFAPNTIGPYVRSASRVGGLVSQMSAHGLFQLADDEALIVRVPDLGAQYMGFELADLWMVSAEYGTRSGSLNDSQALPDADGGRTYVISRRDPGVHNWADPGPIRRGSITLRVQNFDALKADGARPETRLVKLADLDAHLPAGTRHVTPAQRREQRARRLASCNRRVALLAYSDSPELPPERWPMR